MYINNHITLSNHVFYPTISKIFHNRRSGRKLRARVLIPHSYLHLVKGRPASGFKSGVVGGHLTDLKTVTGFSTYLLNRPILYLKQLIELKKQNYFQERTVHRTDVVASNKKTKSNC